MLGTNPVTPDYKTNAEYFTYTGTKQVEKPLPFQSPAKQTRMFGILRSDGMKQALNYNDNDPSYGLVSPKGTMSQGTDKNMLFTSANMQKQQVWKPKVTLQWNEPYRTPLTLQ
jgi:hypothetical protein